MFASTHLEDSEAGASECFNSLQYSKFKVIVS